VKEEGATMQSLSQPQSFCHAAFLMIHAEKATKRYASFPITARFSAFPKEPQGR
jgi:hypothetical protein